ncbi:MAG: efflux RND transporter permease subunit [Rhodobiaceae bacterium]|nr:efflux RND transporter permease subunit [Rhodobiaceae bacterium]
MRARRGRGLVSIFVRHPNAANLLMVLLIIGGVFAMMRMQTQYFPTVEVQRITVTVPWPGASAEDVEANILDAIEPQVRFLDGIKEITAYAREGSGTVLLEFQPDADMQKALSDVETAVDSITTFPDDSEDPRVIHSNWYESIARLAVSGPFSEQALKSFARRIRDDLLAAGIDRVTLSGERSEEIWVEIPADTLRRLDMTLGGVSERIAEATSDLPAGVASGAVERQLRSLTEARQPRDFETIAIRALPGGERIRLGDIADVSARFDDDEPVGFSDGRRAIEINVQRAAAADTLASSRILDSYLARLLPTLPPTVEVVKYDVRSERLMQRINLLVTNGASGLLLVIITLFIFLNARIAIWVAAGIPIAIMATLALMWASGQSINMISLFALILTLGIVVDDAIVVGEHTATVHGSGADPTSAAERGVMRMLVPVTAATLTTQVAFLPLFLVGDVIGQIMRALPLVVIAVLAASLVESFFVLPSHLRHSLAGAGRRRRLISLDGVEGGRRTALTLLAICFAVLAALYLALLQAAAAGPGSLFERLLARALDGSALGYATLLAMLAAAVISFMVLIILFEGLGLRRSFDAAFGRFRSGPIRRLALASFRWRYVTVSLAVSLLLVSAGMFSGGFVKFRFFPSPEAENITATVIFAAGTPRPDAIAALRQIEASARKAERGLGGDKGSLIVAIYSTLGKSGRATDENVAEIDVQLTASEERAVRTGDIVRAWNQLVPTLPGVDRVAISGRGGGPPGRDVDIRLSGAEPRQLKQAALETRDLLSRFPGVSGVADDLPFGRPELVLELTARGSALGFTAQSVGQQIRNGFEGHIAKRFARGEDEVTVRVMYDPENRRFAALRELYLRSPDGQQVPLSEVVSIREKAGFSIIQHRQGKRTVSVTGDIDSKVTTSVELVAALEGGQLADIARKYGVEYAFGGREEERARSFADLRLGVVLALGLIYLILAWVFGNYGRPLAVMVMIPFGAVGAVFGHWFMDFHLSIMSLMALLGLSGILVNDSIILVSRLDERLATGEDLESAAVGAAQDRLRAVLLTSLTTIGGLMPLMFEKNLQAQFLLPMAATLVFGLGIATLLVLFLVPAFIGIGADLRALLAALWRPRAAPEPGE